MDNPRIVTICGSMRFYQEMLAHASKLTIEGVIVLMPFVASETGWIKSMLDELHRQKIAMSHAILVVNPGGYIGESTQDEILYAKAWAKGVEYTDKQNEDS